MTDERGMDDLDVERDDQDDPGDEERSEEERVDEPPPTRVSAPTA
jgi:hypothetical protein